MQRKSVPQYSQWFPWAGAPQFGQLENLGIRTGWETEREDLAGDWILLPRFGGVVSSDGAIFIDADSLRILASNSFSILMSKSIWSFSLFSSLIKYINKRIKPGAINKHPIKDKLKNSIIKYVKFIWFQIKGTYPSTHSQWIR